MIKTVIMGTGRMGSLIRTTAEGIVDAAGQPVFDIVAQIGFDLSELENAPAADVIIDFSNVVTFDAVVAYVGRTGAALVSGTTGYTPEQMDRLRELGRNARVMHSGNYSIGIAVLRHLVAQGTRELPGFDCEIVETHHNQKVDAPSGTAKLLLDAIVDAVVAYVGRTGAALVSGTTGYTPEQMDRLRELGRNARVMHSGNYSIGIAVLRHLVAQGTRELPGFDCEIVETHHNQKVDAPSGTAKLLLDAIVEAEPEAGYYPVYGREGMCGARDPKEIGMHSLRGGTVAGVHKVSFFGQDEEVTLTHRATSRQIFVNGALAAAQKLVTREPGFYTFDQVMFA